jgi:hypothetical protein
MRLNIHTGGFRQGGICSKQGVGFSIQTGISLHLGRSPTYTVIPLIKKGEGTEFALPHIHVVNFSRLSLAW